MARIPNLAISRSVSPMAALLRLRRAPCARARQSSPARFIRLVLGDALLRIASSLGEQHIGRSWAVQREGANAIGIKHTEHNRRAHRIEPNLVVLGRSDQRNV